MVRLNRQVLHELIFPGLVWHISTRDKTLFLTFDDGPTPGITPWILAQLEKYNAKATFFCLGKNVEKYPELFQLIVDNGHAAGNHSYSHRNGWKTENADYYQDIKKSEQVFTTTLFRPPYGKLTPLQIKYLKKKYTIVMWDILSRDYSRKFSGEQCTELVISRATPGSVIVFHDSVKAKKNMVYTLPNVLEHFTGNGFTFSAIPV